MEISMLQGLTGGAVVLVALVIYFVYPTWKVRHIPVPPYTWGVGHLPLLKAKTHQAFIFTKLAREYGPVYRFHAGREPWVMVADAELCRKVAVSLYKSLPNRSRPAMVEASEILKSTLFFSRDETWTGIKNTLLPMFHTERLKSFTPLMTRIVGKLVDRLSTVAETEDVNISTFFQRMSMDVIGEAAFGANFGLLDENPGPDDFLVQAAMKSIDVLRMESGAPISTVVGTFLPFLQTPVRLFLRQIPGSAEWVAHNSDQSLLDRLSTITSKRAIETQMGISTRIDALTLLLKSSRLNKENKKLLTMHYINALTYEMFLVGSETTAVTLSYTIYLLAQHPRVEKKMLEEIDAFGPPDTPITDDDIDQFPYVEMVFKESMRLHTTTPTVTRETAEDIELGGYHIPKGTAVWLVLEALLLNPKDFPNPEEFRPERFEEDCEENKKRHPNAFSPFGMGLRTCIGKRFATQESKIALVQLYQKYTFTLSPATEVPLQTQYGIVVRPIHGVVVRVHKRHI